MSRTRISNSPLKKSITAIKNNSVRGIIIFMKEFRIGSIEVVRAFNSHSHPYPDKEGGYQGHLHLHSLSNIKSEDGDSTLSTGIYGTGTYVSVLE